MSTVPAYDWQLDPWEKVKGEQPWAGLVAGNGLSINIWEKFNYHSLYQEAKDLDLFTPVDAQLFEDLGATNFEQVLHALSTSIRVGEVLERERSIEAARHESVRAALAKAVHSVHIEWLDIPDETLEVVSREMLRYRHVFTTSYDLILYWSLMQDDPTKFLDFFWAGDNMDAFDESTHHFSEQTVRTRVYFLHGALHLVARSDGTTCKRKSAARNLLEQFGKAHRGDDAARPLVVTEADARQKQLSIAANDYLSYCWKTLADCDEPLVLFGHSLSAQDSHLIGALTEHDRPIAVGIRDKSKRKNRQEMHRIASLLHEPLTFFDSATHPLGAEDLRVDTAFAWKLKRRLRLKKAA